MTREYGNVCERVTAVANAIDDGLKHKNGGTTRTRKKASAA